LLYPGIPRSFSTAALRQAGFWLASLVLLLPEWNFFLLVVERLHCVFQGSSKDLDSLGVHHLVPEFQQVQLLALSTGPLDSVLQSQQWSSSAL
jgi:hypothetical protein